MSNFIIPDETDFRRWIREELAIAIKPLLERLSNGQDTETIYTRRQTAKMLNVSLVTLTDWMKRDLPFHKQRGRVYFLRSELLLFIKNLNQAPPFEPGSLP